MNKITTLLPVPQKEKPFERERQIALRRHDRTLRRSRCVLRNPTVSLDLLWTERKPRQTESDRTQTQPVVQANQLAGASGLFPARQADLQGRNHADYKQPEIDYKQSETGCPGYQKKRLKTGLYYSSLFRT